jgi:hypothetical protein
MIRSRRFDPRLLAAAALVPIALAACQTGSGASATPDTMMSASPDTMMSASPDSMMSHSPDAMGSGMSEASPTPSQ